MKKIFALVLALSMVLSLASVSAFASAETSGDAVQSESVMNDEAEVNSNEIQDAALYTASNWVPLTEETWNAGQITPILNNSWIGSPYIDKDAYFSFPCGYNLIGNVYKLSDKSWKLDISGTGDMFDGMFWSGSSRAGVLEDGELLTDSKSPNSKEFDKILHYSSEPMEIDTTCDVVIEEGVTSVSTYAFTDLQGITSVQLPSTLKSIGEQAFSGCRNLTGTVTIPENVKEVGVQAFDTAGITGLVINGDAVVRAHAFASDHDLKDIKINGDATIKYIAFSDISNAKKITIAGNATIEGGGIVYCDSLTTLTLSGKCVLKSGAVCDAPKLTNVTISSGSTVAADAFVNVKYENTIATNVQAAKPASVTVTNVKTKKLNVTWKKVSFGQKYQVQYSTSKDFSKKTTKTVTKNSVAITGLTKNKKYYVRVRAVYYNEFKDKTVYSKWSAVKSVTVKK